MSALITGVMLLGGFHVLGLGPALLLRRWTNLPWRYVSLLTLLATAVISYVVFWIAFVAPLTRLAVVGLAVLISAAAVPVAMPLAQLVPTLRRPSVWGLPLVTALFAAACTWPLLVAGPGVNDRFGWKLPSDNIVPGLFAHRVVLRQSTVRPVPPLWPDGDRASERPPLQAAVVVTVGSLRPGILGHEYQLLATLCQAQWMPALVLLAVACGVRRRGLIVVVAACVCSGFFFVNTIYTWPKLFAAALMLGALAVAVEPPDTDARANRARAIVVAALVALALLAHPGPAFSLVAVPVCWPWLRQVLRLRPTLATAVLSVLTVAAIVAPWIAYQTLVDPPSGRLAREHLGDGRHEGSVVQAIVRANLERPLWEQVRIRLRNVGAQLGSLRAAVWPVSVAGSQNEQFFHHGASLGILLIGLVVVLVRPARGDPAADALRRLAGSALVALVLWSLLVFGEGQALIHHGSPVTTALLFAAGAYGLSRLPSIAGGVLLAVHVLAFLRIWVAPMGWGPWRPDGSGVVPVAGFLILALASLATLAFVDRQDWS